MNRPSKHIILAGLVLAASVADAQALRMQPSQRVYSTRAGLTRTFDVDISLQRTPLPADRTKYEEVVKRFADAVFEQSNGVHFIKTVRFFTNGARQDKADVLWVTEESAWPSAGPRRSLPILNCNLFGTTDMLGEPKNGGYTMAHEWGHYAYGLYDEYAMPAGDTRYDGMDGMPWSTDQPVQNSIMNSQWDAVGGDFKWLNHSSYTNTFPGNLVGRTQSAQQRVYGASGWTVLARGWWNDPIATWVKNGKFREFFPELTAKRPAADTQTIDLPNADARKELKVEWMDRIAYNICIDVSGSMSSEGRMAAARLAAQALVDQAEIREISAGKFSTFVGVTSFSSSASVVVPMREIRSQSDKNAIKAAIAGLTPSGSTAIGDGAALALGQVGTVSNEFGVTRMVFLLSDGANNSGVPPSSVIPNYVAAKVPLFTFAMGAGADRSTLSSLATGTGGQAYASGSSAGIITAFKDAFATATGKQKAVWNSGDRKLVPGAPSSFPIVVDSTMRDLSVTVSYAGTASTATFRLVSPGGTTLTPVLNESDGFVTATFSIVNPSRGSWELRGTASSNVDFTANATTAVDSFGPSIRAGSTTGDTVIYPEPIMVTVDLFNHVGIARATVKATVSDPARVVTTYTMSANPELAGRYELEIPYSPTTPNGTYTVEIEATNPDLKAVYSFEGRALGPPPQSNMSPPADKPVGENFSRTTTLLVPVSGANGDDHVNVPTGSTVLANNNMPSPGHIGYDNDADVFELSMPATGKAFVRVFRLVNGMVPVVRVLGSNGTTVLRTANLTTDESSQGYLAFEVAAAANSKVFVEVKHGATTGRGNYLVSAGPELASDAPSASIIWTSASLPASLGTGPVSFHITTLRGQRVTNDFAGRTRYVIPLSLQNQTSRAIAPGDLSVSYTWSQGSTVVKSGMTTMMSGLAGSQILPFQLILETPTTPGTYRLSIEARKGGGTIRQIAAPTRTVSITTSTSVNPSAGYVMVNPFRLSSGSANFVAPVTSGPLMFLGEWNGRNSSGRLASPGAYLVKVNAMGRTGQFGLGVLP
jgi:uncharacterized protein YegL